jgi:hypothetical protein
MMAEGIMAELAPAAFGGRRDDDGDDCDVSLKANRD